MKIILASGNSGKVRELTAMLAPLNIEVVPQSQVGIKDADETGLTFVENAIIKARHAARESGLPALADDSGLIVSALKGAPGIYSSRYAGEEGNAAKNIAKLLAELVDVAPVQRQAEFYCVLAFMSHAEDPAPLICEGRWAGEILEQPRGAQGFGYDPIFWVASQGKSAAELPAALKNSLSHRGKALQLLLKSLPGKLHESALS